MAGIERASTEAEPASPAPPVESQTSPRSWLQTGLGLFLVAGGCLLLYSLAALWPATDTGTGATTGHAPTVHWLGRSFAPTAETAALIVAVLAGALGGYLNSVTAFADDAGNRALARVWLSWYVVRIVAGAGLAALVYLVARALVRSSAGSDLLNPAGVAAVSGLAGVCATQAVAWLRAQPRRLIRWAVGYQRKLRSWVADLLRWRSR